MEFTMNETNVVEVRTNQAVQQPIEELNELQLALVGGGCGEVIFG